MTDLIPCEICSELFAADQYIIHITTHAPNENNNNHSNHNNHNNRNNHNNDYGSHRMQHIDNRFRMIECKYNDCSTKWIPSHEYNDHLTLHRLQSQQIPNTSNDALIALNHQTQIIEQQTAVDPRRICLSTAFIHLRGNQKPVIPMHDKLISETNIVNITSAPATRDNHNVDGIIQSIDRVLSNRAHIEYYLCDPLLFYYRDREDYSWGCGFRNSQTLSSCLLLSKYRTNNIYKRALFDGVGYVPIIQQIQRYLDYAHAQGFDPEGLKELGLTQGRTVWIGAVDVAAMLRSFHIPAAIYDFQITNNPYHDDLFEWVWHYFVERYNYHKINKNKNKNKNKMDQDSESESESDSGSSFSGDDLVMNETKSNADEYSDADCVNCMDYSKRFIAPLYFQHQGHSRTIIGVMHNKRSGIRHLLVLDPSVKGGGIRLLNNIKKGNIQSLLRSKKQTKARKYQIVAIPTFGIMTNNDRNRCKTIQSMDVTLINKQ